MEVKPEDASGLPAPDQPACQTADRCAASQAVRPCADHQALPGSRPEADGTAMACHLGQCRVSCIRCCARPSGGGRDGSASSVQSRSSGRSAAQSGPRARRTLDVEPARGVPGRCAGHRLFAFVHWLPTPVPPRRAADPALALDGDLARCARSASAGRRRSSAAAGSRGRPKSDRSRTVSINPETVQVCGTSCPAGGDRLTLAGLVGGDDYVFTTGGVGPDAPGHGSSLMADLIGPQRDAGRAGRAAAARPAA